MELHQAPVEQTFYQPIIRDAIRDVKLEGALGIFLLLAGVCVCSMIFLPCYRSKLRRSSHEDHEEEPLCEKKVEQRSAFMSESQSSYGSNEEEKADDGIEEQFDSTEEATYNEDDDQGGEETSSVLKLLGLGKKPSFKAKEGKQRKKKKRHKMEGEWQQVGAYSGYKSKKKNRTLLRASKPPSPTSSYASHDTDICTDHQPTTTTTTTSAVEDRKPTTQRKGKCGMKKSKLKV
eukprot:CAMPEP_0113940236 /NCGR_PEP_ID=MMETSP1339-20121228/6407_1 /TAXON_ID=94617 /ORGANISM="Fibrocapsa japonica" /LENGTH=232 /DNA_ID=CAMNT_0000943993 /DNA_START=55 /DNA_END=750 /DNA_ORIENTATION=- /assembly_acc=CAM_ASM_000762